MKCGRPNARHLQTCFPQKSNGQKRKIRNVRIFRIFKKRLRFRFLAGRKRKRPHPAPRGAGRETQRRLRKCKLEEGWTGEGGWAHAKRKQKKGNKQALKIDHGGKILFFYESCQPPLCRPRLRSSDFFPLMTEPAVIPHRNRGKPARAGGDGAPKPAGIGSPSPGPPTVQSGRVWRHALPRRRQRANAAAPHPPRAAGAIAKNGPGLGRLSSGRGGKAPPPTTRDPARCTDRRRQKPITASGPHTLEAGPRGAVAAGQPHPAVAPPRGTEQARLPHHFPEGGLARPCWGENPRPRSGIKGY